MPPTRDVETFERREALEAMKPELAAIVALTIAAGFIVARKDVLGVITSSGLGRRRTRQPVAVTAFATNSPTGQVADASVFVVGDVLKNAAGVTVGTIQSLNLTTNVITLAANAAVAVAVGADVLGSDGSQVAQAIADQGSDGVGDTPISVYIAGLLKQTGLRGLDSTAKTELGGVSTVGGIFKF